jgi:Homeodomain-like domain
MRAKCLHLLAEGVSIRAAARLTGVSKTTILKLIEDAGRAAGAPIPTGKTRHLPLHAPHFRRAAGRFYLRGNQRLRERSNARGSSRGCLFGGRNGWMRKLFRKGICHLRLTCHLRKSEL